MLIYDEDEKSAKLLESYLSKYDTNYLGFHQFATFYNDLGDIYSNNVPLYSESDSVSIKMAIDYYKSHCISEKKMIIDLSAGPTEA